MKKFYAILCLAIASLTQLQAQAPQGFNYQATVRNSAGDLIVNTNVYFKFNVMQGSQTSLPVFTEIHYAPTDDLGQISLVIGQGSATTGAFSELDWSLGSYFLGIELDTGNGYVAMGTTQLLSVPYALYAENSGNAPPTTPNLEVVLAENNSANNQQIKDLQDPTEPQDAVTKAYIDNLGFDSESSSRYQMDSFSWHSTQQVLYGFNVIDTQTGIVKTYFKDWNSDNYSFYRVTNTHSEINISSIGRFQVSSWSESISTYPYQKLFGFNVIDTQTGTIKCFRNIYPGESFSECSTTNPIDSTYDFDGDGFSESQGDCDDTNDSINTNAVEVCDGIDNDCDGLIDEGVLIIFYQDSDSDGYGNPDVSIESCSLPSGYSNNNLDCDDQNPQVNPEVTEIQDGIDNDCDGIIDEAVLATLTTTTINDITVDSAQSGGTVTDVGGGTVSSRGTVWSTSSTPTLENNEGQTTDGSGSGSFVSSLSALSPGTTYNVRAYATNEAGTAYGQVETFTAEIDFATLTTTAIADITVDSAQSGGTITDVGGGTVSSRGIVWSTSSTPTLENNEGQTTDGSGSGSFVSSLSALNPGTTYNVRAYATNEAGTAYGQTEVFETITENDIDNDGDGYSENEGDCNDDDVAIYPGATEIEDGIDNDCDGEIDEGFDMDVDGYSVSQGDCDDNDATVYPGATELEDGLDNDCDGEIDEGFDVDGDGYSVSQGDCDDNDETIYPGATEQNDGIDNDCDGEIDEGFNESGTVTDQDGNTYDYLTYGNQEWTVENAEMVTYRDGTPIPQVTDPTAWSNLTIGAWCYYDNDPSKGKLYNWYAVAGIHDTDPNTPNKEFAPEGWHVPTDAEWTTLEEYLIANGYNYDGTTTGNKIAKAMASTTGWDSSTNTGAPGNDQSLNNSSAFNAFPLGGRRGSGYFGWEAFAFYFWSSTESYGDYAWPRLISYDNSSLIKPNFWRKDYGCSVRFVRD